MGNQQCCRNNDAKNEQKLTIGYSEARGKENQKLEQSLAKIDKSSSLDQSLQRMVSSNLNQCIEEVLMSLEQIDFDNQSQQSSKKSDKFERKTSVLTNNEAPLIKIQTETIEKVFPLTSKLDIMESVDIQHYLQIMSDKLELNLQVIKNPKTYLDNHRNIYQGNLEGNYFQGLCFFYKRDGDFYYGMIDNNKPTEKGILKHKNKIFLGEFSQGKLEGKGLLIQNDEIKYFKKIFRLMEKWLIQWIRKILQKQQTILPRRLCRWYQTRKRQVFI